MSHPGDETVKHEIARFIVRFFVENQRGPTVNESAERYRISNGEMSRIFRDLAANRTLVLKDDGEVRFCLPFSNVPTRHRVHIGEKKWWAT